MSQEELIHEIKLTNEKLVQALLDTQKKPKIKDWKTNPVLYIIITLFLTFVINFVERKINYDENHMVESALMSRSIEDNANAIIDLKERCDNVNSNFNKLERILLVIRLKVADEEDKEKSWEELVEQYEDDIVRGTRVDSLYSSRIFILDYGDHEFIKKIEEDNDYLARL